ncbi:MAG: hypothetical protein ACTSRP_01160 [Candidatus Helarchaeota archaeon]
MSEKILKIFLQFCGIVEVIIGLILIFIAPVIEALGLSTIPILNQMAGVEMMILGMLLWYSAKDVKKYMIIIFGSLMLRYVMPIFEILGAFTILSMFTFLIGASIYDLSTATITILLLMREGYLFKKD